MRKLRALLIVIVISCLVTVQLFAQSGMLLLGVGSNSVLSLTPGWQWGFDYYVGAGCTATASACTLNATALLPPISGAVSMIIVVTGGTSAARTITGISNTTGGTWVFGASGTSVHNGTNDNISIAYNLGLSTIASSTVVTLSGAAAGFFDVFWVNVIPPTGYTAAFDTAGAYATTTCTTCTGTNNLTLAGTDMVMHVIDSTNLGTGSTPQLAWNACSGAYVYDGLACEEPNATNGTAPTVTFTASQAYFSDVGIAFKSTANSFVVPTPNFVISSLTWTPNTSTICNPCTITFATPAPAGSLIYVQAGAGTGTQITSATSGGSSFTVPAGCLESGDGLTLSCAYLLSTPSGGTTTMSLQMNGGGSMGYEVWVITRSTGTFALDTLNAQTQTSGYSSPIISPSANGVQFFNVGDMGGIGGNEYFPQPFYPVTGIGYYFGDDTSGMILLNTEFVGGASFIAAGGTGTLPSTIVAFK